MEQLAKAIEDLAKMQFDFQEKYNDDSSHVSSWTKLKEKLKEKFLPSDYEQK